ncbi:Ldh family oxidoreductase [Microvirga massiliensis]|uniref:Ldh family oxidoreductase n=1 Tax=Microvirga massiliensis TaxID=1033741 RepID=UPI00062B3969|nr:Ldh family oxidoreductase [Microvirga massiliensis]
MAVSDRRAIKLAARDNVAAVLDAVRVSDSVLVRASDSSGTVETVPAIQDIPLGHKIALRPVAAGEAIIRYGYTIGVATQDIGTGEHVHVHNLRSQLSPVVEADASESVLQPAGWVSDTIEAILEKIGVTPPARQSMARALTEAHLRGVETHGLRRLRPYVERIRSGGVSGSAEPQVRADRAVIRIDGRNGIGHYVASVAADTVAKAASHYGIAIASINNSNHLGFAGYYASLIAQRDQIGIVLSNGQVCVAPTGARRAFLSNNPIAIAAPMRATGQMLELDLAMSATSRANVVAAAKRGGLLPEGWAQDPQGYPTQDAKRALEGSLLAFGGDRGFAFLFALEVLVGLLGGGVFADGVSSKEASPNTPEGTSHTMIAVDLAFFGGSDNFKNRMDEYAARLKALPLREAGLSLRYPGERRWSLRRERMARGIPLSASDLRDIVQLATEFGVERDIG